MPIRLALVLVAMLLAACSGPGFGPQSSAASPTAVLPSSTPAGVSPTLHVDRPPDEQTLTGVLGLESVEGGCAYLQTDGKTRYELIAPQGWELRTSPLELRNPDGEVVATGGETLTVRGVIATDMNSTCQIGPIFQATEVVTIDR